MIRAVALLGLAIPLLSAEEWKRAATANFELFTPAGDQDARTTIEHFERVRDFFLRATGGRGTTPVPVTIVAFANHRQFKPYSPTSAAGAFYTGTESRDYIVLAGTGAEHYPVAIHEYVHLLVRHMGMRLPLWLNEGIAELYSTMRPHGGRLLIGAVPGGRGVELLFDKWLPLRRVLEVDLKSREYNEKKRASMFYSQSWALVHMMMLHPAWRGGFPAFVSAVGAGLTAEQSFQRVWGLALDDVEKRLKRYVESESLTGVLLDMPVRAAASAEVQPADPDQVEVVLATVMGLAGKTGEALKRLNAVADRLPKDYAVQEALGLVELRARNTEAARRHLARAVELRSPRWTTWWDYARLLHLAQPTDRAEIIRVLSKTAELNASHLEARLLLAEEHMRARQPEAAWGALQQIGQVKEPDAARVLLARAIVLAQLNRLPEARTALEEARKYASEPRLRRSIEDTGRHLAERGATPERRFARGVFQEFDCTSQPAHFVVLTESSVLRFAVVDASSVTVDGSDRGRPVSCGVQSEKRQVWVEYVPRSDGDAAGELRAIRFE